MKKEGTSEQATKGVLAVNRILEKRKKVWQVSSWWLTKTARRPKSCEIP